MPETDCTCSLSQTLVKDVCSLLAAAGSPSLKFPRPRIMVCARPIHSVVESALTLHTNHYEAPFAIGLTCSLPFCHRASAKRKNMVGMARPKKQKVEVAETTETSPIID